MQHTATTHCNNTLQHTATSTDVRSDKMRRTATHCITLHLTATHYNQYIRHILQDATHCHTLHHTASHCITQHHIASHCNTLQSIHTSYLIGCNTLQHSAWRYITLHHTTIITHVIACKMQYTATHCKTCNTLRSEDTSCLAICNTLQHASARCNTMRSLYTLSLAIALARCNKLQHTATQCNTLRSWDMSRPARCNTLQQIAIHCNTLRWWTCHIMQDATHCNTSQHIAKHCDQRHVISCGCATRQHTVTHCNHKTSNQNHHSKYTTRRGAPDHKIELPQNKRKFRFLVLVPIELI